MSAVETQVADPDEVVVTIVPALDGSGEVVDLTEADDVEIAEYIEGANDKAKAIVGHAAHAKRQLRDRMDLAFKWTRRIGDPKAGHQWEVSAPSPDAGTDVYHADELLPVLREAVKDGLAGADAANGAMKRTLTLTFTAPIGCDLAELAEEIENGNLPVQVGPDVELSAVAHNEKAHLPGITKLRKSKALAARLDEIREEDKPKRNVTFKRIEKKKGNRR